MQRFETDLVATAGYFRQRVARWWQGEAGVGGRILDMILAPAELLYRCAVSARAAAFRRGWLRVHGAPVRVVSVGNLTVGGTGKTPVSRWVAEELRRRGERPAILHGGYGLDEPELHRHWLPGMPVIAGRDRLAGAGQAVDAGATVLVLDDGFQHQKLARDLDLVLVSAEQWTGRVRLLPRGPWREPPAALRRASAVIVTRKSTSAARAATVANEVEELAPGVPVALIHIAPAGWLFWGGAPTTAPAEGAVAVASIAAPASFVSQAESAGARVETVLSYPDHHEYSQRDLKRIEQVAAGRPILTTAKDAVKLADSGPWRELRVLEQKVIVEAGSENLAKLLDRVTA